MVLANTLVSVETEVTADDGNHATKTGLVSHRARWAERTNQAATALATRKRSTCTLRLSPRAPTHMSARESERRLSPPCLFLARRFEGHGLCSKHAAFGIHHLDQHLVLTARHVDQDDRVALAVIRPSPR